MAAVAPNALPRLIALPVTQPGNPAVVLLPAPPVPAVPPTAADVKLAGNFRDDVALFRAQEQATDVDVANSEAYRLQVVLEYGGVIARGVDAALAQQLPGALAAALPMALAPVNLRTLIIASKAANRGAGNGTISPFEEVPFPNGVMPTEGGNGLPPLQTAGDINALNGHDASAYFTGYYPGVNVPHLVDDTKAKIRQAIGCLQNI